MGERLLKMEGISKAFPGVQALKDVSLNVYAGEAMALLGENGAGKSTLMKVLTGIYTRDEGTVTYGGREVVFRNSRDAAEQGISIIHQELNLIPHMKIYENIFLGREIKNGRGGLNKKAMIARTRELLDSINVSLDPEREIKGLSIAMQQMVEIAKALSLDAQIIIMDEPTGALPDEEVDSLFRIVRDLKQKGKGIIYILINCAGMGHPIPAIDVTQEDWDTMMDLNLRGAFFCAQAAARHMLKAKSGHIVNITSQISLVANEGETVYCASKGGMNQMTRVLALEWGAQGVIVNAVAPTFTYTPGTAERLDQPEFRASVLARIPRGELGTIDDIASAVHYLVSGHADMASGSILVIDGGWTSV